MNEIMDLPVPDPVRMQQLLAGFEVSQTLYAMAELDVATVLMPGPLPVVELATRVGAHTDALGRVIRFLASFGVFEMSGDVVTLTGLGATLAAEQPGSVRDLARYWMETHYGPFGSLLYTVQTGETAATDFLGEPFLDWITTTPRLAQLQKSATTDAGSSLHRAMAAGYRLPPGHVTVEIGGADQSVLTQLLADEPDRRGIVFGLPHAVADVREALTLAGLGDRVEVMAGDFFDRVPLADVYDLSVMLHDWDDDYSGRILRAVAKSASPTTRLVLIEAVMPEDNQPHHTKRMDLVTLAMLGGRERTAMEWRTLLNSAGFAIDRIVPGDIFSVIEASPQNG